MIQFPHLAERVFNTPVAIMPEKAMAILSGLSGRFGISEILDAEGNNFPLSAQIASQVRAENGEVGYAVEEGIAIIPVSGTLVHKNGWLRPFSGMTGYDGIRHNLTSAIADPKVKGIAFDIDSGGGEVAGCFDLCNMIYDARGEKPMMAILSECAYSAAYAIASSCDIVAVPRTGGTGSVGIIAVHVDYSERLENEGVKVTMVHYGARKIDGNEASPLSKEGLEKLQQQVNNAGEMFVDLVARNRGMTKKAVRGTEAACFFGKDGVEVGFADEVCAPNEAFQALVEHIR